MSIIRGLATGQVFNNNASTVVIVEAKMGLALRIVLVALACARVWVTSGDMVSAVAIGAPSLLLRRQAVEAVTYYRQLPGCLPSVREAR